MPSADAAVTSEGGSNFCDANTGKGDFAILLCPESEILSRVSEGEGATGDARCDCDGGVCPEDDMLSGSMDDSRDRPGRRMFSVRSSRGS